MNEDPGDRFYSRLTVTLKQYLLSTMLEFRMAIRFATVFLAVFATVNSQPRRLFTSSGTTLGGKPGHFVSVSEDDPTYINRPWTNCPFEGQGYIAALAVPQETQRKESYNKVPVLHWEIPRFADERLLFPFGGYRPKKSQKAIMLDVGDFVNKSPLEEAEAAPPRASVAVGGGGVPPVGGFLRSSG